METEIYRIVTAMERPSQNQQCDDLTTIRLCYSTILHHRVNAAEKKYRRQISYGDDLYFDFEYLSSILAGLALRAIEGQAISDEYVRFLREFDWASYDSVAAFLADHAAWDKLPGMVAEFMLLKQLLSALNEYAKVPRATAKAGADPESTSQN